MKMMTQQVVSVFQSQHLQGALLFSILFNLKHIFLYVAPAYGIYLLRSYCFTQNNQGRAHSCSRRHGLTLIYFNFSLNHAVELDDHMLTIVTTW